MGKLGLQAHVRLAALASLFVSATAWGDFYLHAWENRYRPKREWRFAPTATYYTSSTNFDLTGTPFFPAGLTRYTRLHTDIEAEFGLTSTLAVFGRLGWALVSVDHDPNSGNSFGFSDQSAGAVVRIFGKPGGVSLDAQARFDFPLYSNVAADQNSTPFLGDGSIDKTFGGFLTVPLLSNKERTLDLVAGAGITTRGAGFSSAIPWSVAANYSRLGDKGFEFGVAALGIQSLKSDEAQTSSPTPSVSQESAGGSYFINAINPSLITVRGTIQYKFSSRIAAVASASKAIWGQGSPDGFAASLGAQFTTGAPTAENASEMTPGEYGKSNQGFVNYMFQATVIRVNDRLQLVKIDKGQEEGVEVGQVFDIFAVKQDGTITEAVARAKVTEVKVNEAALQVLEYYREVWIEEGFIVKKPLE